MITLGKLLPILARNGVKTTLQIHDPDNPYRIHGEADSIYHLIGEYWEDAEVVDIEVCDDTLTLWAEKVTK